LEDNSQTENVTFAVEFLSDKLIQVGVIHL